MNEGLTKYYQFLKWFFVFIILETVILIASINKDFFLFKILINYLVLVGIIPFIFEKIEKRKIDPFSPIAIFSFFYILLFGAKAVDLVIFRQKLLLDDEKYYSLALIYAIIGLHLFQIGYYSNAWRIFIRKKNRAPQDWSLTKFKIILISYSLISFISFLIIIKLTGGLSFYFHNIHAAMVKITSGSALFFMAVLIVEIPLLIWFSYVLELRRNVFIFGLYLILVVLLFIFLGERGHVISLIMSLLAFYHYAKQKLNLKPLFIVGLVFILFLSLFGQYREFSKYNFSIKKAGFNAKIGFEAIYQSVMSDFDQFIRFMDIIKYTPEKIDFQIGKTFLNLFLKPIPSRIWEDKPQGAGVIITKNLYPKHYSAHVSIAPSLVGELYLNFHLIGIITGMFLFGVVCRGLFEMLQHNKRNKNVIVLYAILLPFVYSELRGDFAVVTSFLIFKLFFLFLALYFITRKRITVAGIDN